MSSLSIITAVLPSSADHLDETARSIEALRASMDLEWVLVFDGPGAESTERFGADSVIHLPSHRGTATARNIGFVSSSGDFIHVLDGDDLALPGLRNALRELEQRPDLGWVAPNRVLVSGERTIHWHGSREWYAGELAASWATPFPFHPNSAIYRRAALFLAGGTPAISPGDDMALMLMVSEHSSGMSVEDVATAYRVWPKQAVQSELFYERALISRRFLEQTLNALRSSKGRDPIVAPAPARKSLSLAPLAEASYPQPLS